MASPATLIDTTFSGKDISSAASVYEYTADDDYTIRIQVRVSDGAGGDYIAYLNLNDGDAQSDDPMLPKSTISDAAARAFWLQTLTIDVKNGDVINVMLEGVADDTDVSGSVRIFADNYAEEGDEMALAGDYDAAKTAAQASDVTVTIAVSQAEASNAARGTATIELWHTYTQSFTSTSTEDLSSATKLWFSLKNNKRTDEDDESLLFVEKTAGLTIVAQEIYAATTDGSISVTGSVGNWSITVTIDESVTGYLENWEGKTLDAQVKAIVDDDTIDVWSGDGAVKYKTVRSTS